MQSAAASNDLPAPLLSVAPMMEWTDVFFRQVVRLMSRHSWLYTEMVVDKTLIHNPNHDKFLWFPPEQHPVVCQLGGSVPDDLAAAAVIVGRYGYDEINLNCGCPSPKVAGKGCFGATMMTEPQLVADCCAAMARAVDIPITVKCRLGVDSVDSYKQLCHFVRTVSEGAPVRHFLIHCRKAILGLDPSENRSVPPLRRGWAFALSRDFPHLKFTINGQVASTGEALQTLSAESDGGRAAGVMIGRAAWKKPWEVFGDADRAVFGAASNPAASRREVLQQYADFADGQLGRWGKKRDGSPLPGLRALVSPTAQLFFAEPGCGKWKRLVDAALRRKDITTMKQLLAETLHVIPDAVLDAPPRIIVQTMTPMNLEMPASMEDSAGAPLRAASDAVAATSPAAAAAPIACASAADGGDAAAAGSAAANIPSPRVSPAAAAATTSAATATAAKPEPEALGSTAAHSTCPLSDDTSAPRSIRDPAHATSDPDDSFSATSAHATSSPVSAARDCATNVSGRDAKSPRVSGTRAFKQQTGAIGTPYDAALCAGNGEASIEEGPVAASVAATADVDEQPQLMDEQQALSRGHPESGCLGPSSLGGRGNTLTSMLPVRRSDPPQHQRIAQQQQPQQQQQREHEQPEAATTRGDTAPERTGHDSPQTVSVVS